MSDQEVEDFLEHFGVKGMKWGQRRARKPTSKGENNTDRQNAAKATGAGAAGIIAARATYARTMNAPLSLVVGAAATVAGARWVQRRIDESNDG